MKTGVIRRENLDTGKRIPFSTTDRWERGWRKSVYRAALIHAGPEAEKQWIWRSWQNKGRAKPSEEPTEATFILGEVWADFGIAQKGRFLLSPSNRILEAQFLEHHEGFSGYFENCFLPEKEKFENRRRIPGFLEHFADKIEEKQKAGKIEDLPEKYGPPPKRVPLDFLPGDLRPRGSVDRLKKFLRENVETTERVRLLYEAAKNFFGGKAKKFELESIEDPEDWSEIICLTIHTKFWAEEAFEKLENFESEIFKKTPNLLEGIILMVRSK